MAPTRALFGSRFAMKTDSVVTHARLDRVLSVVSLIRRAHKLGILSVFTNIGGYFPDFYKWRRVANLGHDRLI